MMDNISSKRAEQQVAVTVPEYDQIPVDKYQTRVIAFVDLLVFSQLIEDTENGKRTESNIYSAIQLIYDVLFDFEANSPKGSGDRYLNHLYTIKKWHVQQERFPIAESITLY